MPHHLPVERAATVNTLFAQICRETPEKARDLSMLLTMLERAAVALACNARTHLRAQGRAIASVWTLASLVREGGQAGSSLFSQTEAGVDIWKTSGALGKRRVPLFG
ncbi:MAG: hypothetical protein ACRYGP_13080 [Janthinobacterium lividum]